MHDHVSGIIVTDARVCHSGTAACAWLVPMMHELYALLSMRGTNPLESVHYLYCSLLLYHKELLSVCVICTANELLYDRV